MPRFPAGLAALNATQFLGAMNDNILKLLIIFCLIQAQGSQRAGAVTASPERLLCCRSCSFQRRQVTAADRYSKALISRAAKVLEVIVTALALSWPFSCKRHGSCI